MLLHELTSGDLALILHCLNCRVPTSVGFGEWTSSLDAEAPSKVLVHHLNFQWRYVRVRIAITGRLCHVRRSYVAHEHGGYISKP